MKCIHFATDQSYFSMTVRYRRSKLSDDRTSEYPFSWRVFSTWDYGLSNRQAVRDHRTAICTDTKVGDTPIGIGVSTNRLSDYLKRRLLLDKRWE